MSAAHTGNVAIIKSLLAHGANVNAVDPRRGHSALMRAIADENSAAARVLIEAGADVKAKSKMYDQFMPMVLTSYGSNVQVTSRGGYTPLLFAVRNNHLDTVKFLLSKGADPNDKIGDNTPALSMSVLNADFDVASVLLDAGANPNVPDQRGYPLHVLAWIHRPGAPPDFAMSGIDPQPVPRPKIGRAHV